ncbi:MAG: hypothetical protein HQL56_09815 [Magnetococcales bacterium]|nr:hypothetical protein [Magnetococcales bacterium]
MTDYLALGGLIASRLKEVLERVPVELMQGKPLIGENPDISQSVSVFLEEDRPEEQACGGKSQKVEQRWVAAVAVRDADDAGRMISRTISALAGWQPPDRRFAPLRRVPSTHNPDWTPAGVFYFPVAFATTFVFNTEG